MCRFEEHSDLPSASSAVRSVGSLFLRHVIPRRFVDFWQALRHSLAIQDAEERVSSQIVEVLQAGRVRDRAELDARVSEALNLNR